MRRSKTLIATSIVAVIALGACSSSAKPSSAKPLSEGKWKQQASAICTQMYNDLNKLQDDTFGPNSPTPVPPNTPSADQLAAFAKQVVPVIKGAVASIDALNEPEALKDGVKDLKTAALGDATAIDTDPGILGLASSPFVKTSTVGKRLGLTCL